METILVVEDDYLSRDALSRRLERSGYQVLRAVDGEQAIAMAHSAPPDLILMDLGLPVLDGWQATKRLKADSATRDIPIIIVSAHVQASDRAMVLAAGGDDLDSKPVDFDGLLIKIGTLLKRPH
jgi:CheY-like chemotaxis protein